MKIHRPGYYAATAIQLLVPLVLLWLLRFPFVYENPEATGNLSPGRTFILACHGMPFDLCAWAWFNAPFILLRFLPFGFTRRRGYLLATEILFFVANLLMLLPAVADIPFFQFNSARLRWQSLTTIWSDPSMTGIVVSYAADYARYFLGALALAAVLGATAFCIRPKESKAETRTTRRKVLLRSVLLLGVAGVTFLCIRGKAGPGRPLSVADAVWHTQDAREANVVLNTPFCIIRTLHADERINPLTFFSAKELATLRDSRRRGTGQSVEKKRNIMVIALESGSSIWVDRLNPVENDSVRGLMPFLDSIASVSRVFPNTFATGVRSIEGITAIFGGVPTYNEMILLSSPYYANRFDAPASKLKEQGYSSRFYFGGNHGSFNIDQTLKRFGFDEIVTRSEYGDDSDFDGAWGIWDHRMGEYAARDISHLPEPFIAGWFTLNPHGPYDTPSDWQTTGYKSKDDMRRTVEYEDRALRRFFEVARREPWFDDTVFVFVGDHGFRDLKGTKYDAPGILPHIVMMVYAPDGSVEPGVDSRVAGQYDVAPTLLALAGYPGDYISLGQSMLDDDRPEFALMYIKGTYRLFGKRYAISFSNDFSKVEGVYDRIADPAMTHPLADYDREEVKRLTELGRAFMQDYTTRLNKNILGS
ncbi:MAG: sulfatase-like hydrolase/transferase [Muribaculaceae bacterium]|nr:sulfatase-like hydrolase/transferase [Muribaculaceae bacterium]